MEGHNRSHRWACALPVPAEHGYEAFVLCYQITISTRTIDLRTREIHISSEDTYKRVHALIRLSLVGTDKVIHSHWSTSTPSERKYGRETFPIMYEATKCIYVLANKKFFFEVIREHTKFNEIKHIVPYNRKSICCSSKRHVNPQKLQGSLD